MFCNNTKKVIEGEEMKKVCKKMASVRFPHTKLREHGQLTLNSLGRVQAGCVSFYGMASPAAQV